MCHRQPAPVSPCGLSFIRLRRVGPYDQCHGCVTSSTALASSLSLAPSRGLIGPASISMNMVLSNTGQPARQASAPQPSIDCLPPPCHPAIVVGVPPPPLVQPTPLLPTTLPKKPLFYDFLRGSQRSPASAGLCRPPSRPPPDHDLLHLSASCIGGLPLSTTRPCPRLPASSQQCVGNLCCLPSRAGKRSPASTRLYLSHSPTKQPGRAVGDPPPPRSHAPATPASSQPYDGNWWCLPSQADQSLPATTSSLRSPQPTGERGRRSSSPRGCVPRLESVGYHGRRPPATFRPNTPPSVNWPPH